MCTNQIINTYKHLFGTRHFNTLIHLTMHRNQWHLCLEVYRSTLIQHNYLATPPVHLGVYKTWSLVCLGIALAKSISCDQSFLLRYTWVFSLVMPIYRPQYIERVWCWSPSSCTSFFDILLLNLIRMNHCRSFKTTWSEEVPYFPVVWGPHSDRWRSTLSHARWRRMYDQATPPSGKTQWHADWVGTLHTVV